ncbi:MAG: MBL fold metallo-hydrolase [Saprospiraceae bacterium]|nr:MBL fold metallo-hydrolase [Saprospiraceae bacterium]MBK7738621.1 MBL fold metallo-hydrolase [Saprospiraceae bacterium]MBK7912807.1 MBL fold metallo-hydrolase [Saprospiraceae bacterium]
MKSFCELWFLLFMFSFNWNLSAQDSSTVLLLGIAQDGSYPHMGCEANCCKPAWKDSKKARMGVSLAVIDPQNKKWYLFEATPDISKQIHLFNQLTNNQYPLMPDGIFITHAHIGHYSGLMQLGREVKNSKEIPVFGLERFCNFIKENGPWSQLVKLNNIVLQAINPDQKIVLSASLSVTAFTVPHRDEFSETAGFKINSGGKSYLFIPDIDKWNLWNRNIVDEVKNVDLAFLDATFYSMDELKSRNIQEVPHPTVKETMDLFLNESKACKSKIVFIHMNHTNPLIWSKRYQKEVLNEGFKIGIQGERY